MRPSLPIRLVSAAIICGTAFLVDQISKWTILTVVMQPPHVIPVLPFFNLTLGFNTGVSFGMFKDFLEGHATVFAGAKLVIALGLAIWAVISTNRFERAGLAMIAGGALGNILDRFRQGAVTDFLDVHWDGWHFPTFNLADVAISLGIGLMLITQFTQQKAA